jgi:hypothetical protein
MMRSEIEKVEHADAKHGAVGAVCQVQQCAERDKLPHGPVSAHTAPSYMQMRKGICEEEQMRRSA